MPDPEVIDPLIAVVDFHHARRVLRYFRIGKQADTFQRTRD
jgi:hypothetical protein